MWIWLLLDSIFYYPRYYRGDRGKRIAVSAISIILVLVLFYPSAVYAAYSRKAAIVQTEEVSTGQDERNIPSNDENTPLLA